MVKQMLEIKAPNSVPFQPQSPKPTIFLAGSIEQGKAEPWQEEVAQALVNYDVVLLNPRRDDWNASWSQDPVEGHDFIEQVNWELDNILFRADVVAFYFDAATISPVTLLELGLCIAKGKDVRVYCPETYFRHGNVYLTMKRFGMLRYLFVSKENFIHELQSLFLHHRNDLKCR